MTSKTVADLLYDLRITRSLSRPKVSNDNPFSESAFKTLKYCPAFPGTFSTLGEASRFSDLFFAYYNTEHRHSGIGLYTPQSVHDGSWKHLRDARQAVLDAAYRAHPERFNHGAPPGTRLARPGVDQQPPRQDRDQQRLAHWLDPNLSHEA